MEDPITTAEAAEMLGVKEREVRRLITAGALPAQKFGAAWMLERADVVKMPRRGRGRPRRIKRKSKDG